MFRLFSNELLAPENSPTATGGNTSLSGSGDLSKEDMIEFMADDDEAPVLELPKEKEKEKDKDKDKEKKKDKEKEEQEEETPSDEEETPDEEIDELAELEEEIQPPTEEQLELVTPVRRKEILKKYPNLFKDFPYLEKAYYREQQFTEIVPTIEDAKVAVEKAKTLDGFESELIGKGNTENILKAVKEENPNAFNRIVDEYLPTLAKVDEKAYYHVLGNLTKHTIVAMVQEANRSNNEPLKLAAQILNQFVFGSSDFSPPTKLSKEGEEQPKEGEKQNTREQQLLRQSFDNTLGDLNSRVNNTLKNTIDAHIDPKNTMTDYVKKNAARDALDSLNALISQDSRFKQLADKLWEKAIEENFSRTSVDRIKSAYLSKARTLLPSVIKKARGEALRGMGKRASSEDQEETTPKKGPIPAGRPRSQQPSGKIKEAKDIPRGMSTLDFLNSD